MKKINAGLFGALFLLILVLPRSFSYEKFPVLLFAFFVSIYLIYLRKAKIYDFNFIIYYLLIFIGCAAWSLIGLIEGNSLVAIWDAIRLFIIFLFVYMVLTIVVSNLYNVESIVRIIYFAGILISIIIFTAVADVYFDLNLISASIKDALNLRVGIHDSYVQVTNHNAGMFGFIIPVLMTQIMIDEKPNKTILVGMFITMLLAVALTSRRAILLLIMLMPFLILFLSTATDVVTKKRLNSILWSFWLFSISATFFIITIYLLYEEKFNGFIAHFIDALNEGVDAPRVIQFNALMNSFFEVWWHGSGFGGVTSYFRNPDSPWMFELSYIMLLFNLGLFGFTIFMLIMFYFVAYTLWKIRVSQAPNKSIYTSLVAGFLGMFIISYTNPYVSSSFDFLFVISIIPFILNSINVAKAKRFYFE